MNVADEAPDSRSINHARLSEESRHPPLFTPLLSAFAPLPSAIDPLTPVFLPLPTRSTSAADHSHITCEPDRPLFPKLHLPHRRYGYFHAGFARMRVALDNGVKPPYPRPSVMAMIYIKDASPSCLMVPIAIRGYQRRNPFFAVTYHTSYSSSLLLSHLQPPVQHGVHKLRSLQSLS